MSNVENDLKSLLPYLNQLERELNRDQQMVRPSPGVNNPQQMYRNLKRMVEDMEQKLVEIPTTTVRTSPHLSRTMPNLSQRSENSHLRQLADRLREQIDSLSMQQAEEYPAEDENNLSLNHEVEYGQGEFKRYANRSLPAPSYQRNQNVPNNFRQTTYPTAPRPIQLNDNLSNRNYNQPSNKTTRGQLANNGQLVDIESRLDEIRSAFDKIEQYSDANRQKRQDHVNRQLMQGERLTGGYASNFRPQIRSSSGDMNQCLELAQNREELAQLEEEQRSLQRMTDRSQPKTVNHLSDYHSVLAEQGTPRNERQCSLDQLNPDLDTATVILEHHTDDTPNARLSRVERLLVQALSKVDNHDKDIAELKESSNLRPPIPLLQTSTPGPKRPVKKQPKPEGFTQYMEQKRPLQFDSEQDQIYSLCAGAIEAHQDNSPFLIQIMALIVSANTTDLRRKIIKAVEHVLEDDDSDSIGTVSDDDVEGDEQMSDQTKAFLQDDLTDLVKQIVQPVVIRLLAQPDENRVFKSTELDDILATILSCSGVMGLKARLWKQFVESVRDPMLRFVGKHVEREQMVLELSEILFNEIHYIRTILSGKPFTLRMENVRPGEVDRHVSYDAGRDHDDQKNIELSVAEVQALTCYGSGEDEESDGGSIDEKNENEMKNPETAINEPIKDNSGTSSPVVVETEKKEDNTAERN